MSIHEPTRYELRVAGLGGHSSDWPDEVDITATTDRTSTLTTTITDRAQLYGLLERLHSIGATVLSMRSTSPADNTPSLQHPLRTGRLTLRPATEHDTEATWSYRGLESVSRWITSAPGDLGTYRALFTDPVRLATTVIVELNDDEPGATVIGDLMLRRQDAWSQREVAAQARGVQAELGWVLSPAYAGRGHATDAVRELIRHCFEDLRLHRVVAHCFQENHSSWRLMERLGMRRETYAVRESLHRSGRWLDIVGYALLANEWATQTLGN